MSGCVHRAWARVGPRAWTCGGLVLWAAVFAEPARANPLDTFGFTSRASGAGGGFTAAAEGTDALYYNVAGLAERAAGLVHLGVLGAYTQKRAGDTQLAGDWLALLHVGATTPLPLGETMRRRLFLGVAAAAPLDGLYRIDLPDDRAAQFPLLGARNHRLVLLAGLAARVFDAWQVGLGLSVLPDVRARILVDLKGPGGRNEGAVRVDYNVMPFAGMKFRVAPWLALGLSYRAGQRSHIDIAPVDVDVAESLDPVRAQVTAVAYAQPHQLAFGADVRPIPELRLAFDLTWAHFGDWQVESPAVALCAACPRECPAGNCPAACVQGGCDELFRDSRAARGWKDTVAPRVGAEWQAFADFFVRAGYGFVGSPVPAQTGATNHLDGARHVVSLGAGYVFQHLPPAWPARVAIDAHAQVQIVPEVGYAKDATDADGDGVPDLYVAPVAGTPAVWPTVSGAAWLVSFGADVRVEF